MPADLPPARRRRRPTYADVAATVALLAATGTGGAYAAGLVGSADIADNAVKTRHIAKGQVKSQDLKGNAVKGAKVKNGSLTGADLADGTVSGKDLAPAVPGVALASAAVRYDGVLSNSFNRLGGPLSAVRTALGTYEVTVPGAHFTDFQGLMYSVHGGYARYCYVNDGGGNVLEIKCREFDNDPSDANVKFVLFDDR
jgi:hypothetical protein